MPEEVAAGLVEVLVVSPQNNLKCGALIPRTSDDTVQRELVFPGRQPEDFVIIRLNPSDSVVIQMGPVARRCGRDSLLQGVNASEPLTQEFCWEQT